MKKENQILNSICKYYRLILLLIDFTLLNYCFLLSKKLIILFELKSISSPDNLTPLILFSNSIWILLTRIHKAYSFIRFETADKNLSRLIKMLLNFVIILYLDIFFFRYVPISCYFISIYSILFISSTFLFRIFYILILKSLRKNGYNTKNIVFIGIKEKSIKFERKLKSELTFGYNVLGFFTDKEYRDNSIQIIGKIDDFFDYAKNNKIDEVYFTTKSYAPDKIKKIISFCDSNFIRFKLIPDFQDYTASKFIKIDYLGETPVLHFRKEPLENPFNKLLKRTFDIVFSLIIIVTIFPWLFPIVIFLQKIFSKGKIFFIQKRSGQNNKVFNCIKFRTMNENNLSDTIGTFENDPRITKFGKYLRKFKIDELPQFINVILGQMSIVGPRPHMLKHTEEYSKLVDEFLVRHNVKPGITGWAQTTGYIDENQKLQEMIDKVKKDVWYIENWTMILDIRIIWLTIYNIFKTKTNNI